MITVEQIKEKVSAYPQNGSVDELINDIVLEYKIEKGLEDFENGRFKDWDEFKKEMNAWGQSK
jgi:predicted transcriptional regulator